MMKKLAMLVVLAVVVLAFVLAPAPAKAISCQWFITVNVLHQLTLPDEFVQAEFESIKVFGGGFDTAAQAEAQARYLATIGVVRSNSLSDETYYPPSRIESITIAKSPALCP